MTENNNTREYNHSKLNSEGSQIFKGSILARLIRNIVAPHTAEGDTVSVGYVVDELRKSKQLRISHEVRLAGMVGDCVREGSVKGFHIKRGRAGGIYNIAAFKSAFGDDAFKALRASREVAKLEKASAKKRVSKSTDKVETVAASS